MAQADAIALPLDRLRESAAPFAVLYVEDDAALREQLAALLGKFFGRVATAASAEEGLDLHRHHRFDLVVTDIRLPGTSGLEMARLIKGEEPHIPVIVTTAFDDKELLLAAIDCGVDRYVLKPFDLPLLLDALQKCLDQLLLERELRRRRDELAENNRRLTAEVARRERLEGEMAEALEALRSFTYSVSHDLRAPLRAIVTFADLLQTEQGSLLDAAGRDYLARIAAAAGDLERLIRDLLDYNRASRTALTGSETALEGVVTAALAQLAAEIEESGAEVEVAAPLPAVIAHPATLLTVLTNLIGNAVKFVAAGNRPELRIAARQEGGAVEIVVEDRGIGIPEPYRERIFRPFERLHDRGSYPGTGMGLAIVRAGVQRMSGTVRAEGRAGGGSRFVVTLPAAVEGQ